MDTLAPLFRGRKHPAIDAVRDALNGIGTQSCDQPVVAEQLRIQIDADVGEWDTAIAEIDSAIVRVNASLDREASDELGAWAGALNGEAAIVCARTGQEGRARHYLDRAEAIARRLPNGYMHSQTYFSPSVIDACRLSIAVELGKMGEALHYVSPLDIASRPRRARHLIECARAYVPSADYGAVLRLLKEAHHEAAETVQFNLYARKLILDATATGSSGQRRDASAFAVRIGFA